MDNNKKKLPDSELEVMLAVWSAERPLHTGEILQALPDHGNRKLQSVQVLLGRLVEKGFVAVEKRDRLNYYTPLAGEEEYRRQETKSFIGKLYGHSPSRLVAALVQDADLSDQEWDAIRALLDREEGKDG